MKTPRREFPSIRYGGQGLPVQTVARTVDLFNANLSAREIAEIQNTEMGQVWHILWSCRDMLNREPWEDHKV